MGGWLEEEEEEEGGGWGRREGLCVKCPLIRGRKMSARPALLEVAEHGVAVLSNQLQTLKNLHILLLH